MQIAEAMLEASRRDKIYVPDPIDTEMMVSPECMHGTCGGIKFEGGDCDDLAAGLAAALASVGVYSAIVGQYDEAGELVHVLVAAWDGTRWWYADPSHESYKLGQSDISSKERWVDVVTGRVICDGVCDQQKVPEPPTPNMSRPKADFVGVGSDPNDTPCVSMEPAGFSGWSFVAGLATGAALAAAVAWFIRK